MSIYRRGRIYWADIATASGKRIKKSLGTSDRIAAQEAHDKLKHELWKVEKLGEKPLKTWDEAALQWLKEKGGKRTLAQDGMMILRYSAYFEKRYINTLTAEEIHRVTAKITNGDTSYNRHLALMRGILLRAERHWRWIERAPALTLKREQKRRIRWLTAPQADRLLAELPEHLADMVEFSLHTGLRQANVTGLTWSQVDVVRRVAFVASDDFKNGNDHAVPLNEVAMGVIRRRIGTHDTHVFTFKGKSVTQVNTKAFRNALARAGIEDFRWHDLRHTWASWLAQAGTPLHVLQELGGWESEAMVRRYAHLSREHLAEYVGRLNGTNSPTVEPKWKTG
jgi:integrase